MLVLAVNVDQVLAETLEQRHRDRRVVHERAVPAGARELAANHDLAVVGAEARRLQDAGGAAALRQLEHSLDGRRLRLGPDDVGLSARTTQQQQRIDQDRFAGAGLSGEDVEAGREGDGDVLDDGEVPDPQLAEHPPRL